MRDQFSAELLKARSGGALPALLLTALLLAALGQLGAVYGESGLADPGVAAATSHRVLIMAGSCALFASLFGALVVTGEFRSGAIGRTVLHAPGRSVVVAAKLGAATVAGLLFGLLAVAEAATVGALALAARGSDLALDARSWGIAGAAVAVCGLGGLWGAAIGWVVRHQLAAVVGLLVWGTVGQLLVLGQLPGFGRFLPEGAQYALLGDRLTFPEALSVPLGGLLLALWCVLVALAGRTLFLRQDV
ncbi:ABC transporter permease [Kitasatospora sp. NPDC087861]|uniref:ABC transporter permease n=1 Tax=Kitasatospora sp. NPDC087861 TaxID=3364070 RepID=UPI003818C290